MNRNLSWMAPEKRIEYYEEELVFPDFKARISLTPGRLDIDIGTFLVSVCLFSNDQFRDLTHEERLEVIEKTIEKLREWKDDIRKRYLIEGLAFGTIDNKETSSKKWVLIGSYEEHEYAYGGYTGNSKWVEEEIATFDTEKMARDYIEKSKLKNPKDYRRPFRKNSLLSRFRYAEVEIYDPEILTHNPTI